MLRIQHTQSKRRNKTLSPQWKAKHFQDLHLVRNSLPLIHKSLLLLQMRDHDHFSGDDLIGFGYLPLRDALENVGEWTNFSVRLTFEGGPAGVFRGKYLIEVNDVNGDTAGSAHMSGSKKHGGVKARIRKRLQRVKKVKKANPSNADGNRVL